MLCTFAPQSHEACQAVLRKPSPGTSPGGQQCQKQPQRSREPTTDKKAQARQQSGPHSDSQHHLQAESAGQVGARRSQDELQQADGPTSYPRSQKATLGPPPQCRARQRNVTAATRRPCCVYTAQMQGTSYHGLAEIQDKYLTGSAWASLARKTGNRLTANPRSGSYVYSNCGNTRARPHFLSTSPYPLGLALQLTATPARIIPNPPVSRAG